MSEIVKKIFWKLIILLMMICEVLLFIHLVQASSRKYEGNSNKRINIVISEEGVNRIGVTKDRIEKVVGNGEEYNIEGDSRSGVIFITSKLSGGEISPITIITEKGYMQGINLKIERGKEARSVVIKKPLERGSKQEEGSQQGMKDIKQNVIEAIRDISSGNRRNYSFRKIGIEGLSRTRDSLVYKGYRGLINSGVKVTRITEYTSRYLKVHRYEYEEKPAKLVLRKIAKIVTSYVFPESLAVSGRGNEVYVVYIQ